MPNPYLVQLREQYAALKAAIAGIQAGAKAAGRGMNEDELASVRAQGERGEKMAAEIELLAGIEARDNRIAAMETAVASATGPAVQPDAGLIDTTRGVVPVGGTATADRDPGHYRQTADRGSFFSDILKSKEGVEDATRRLHENARYVAATRGMNEVEGRALTTSSAGTGVIAPKWMTDLFAARTTLGRPLTSKIRNIPLGTDPRPMTLPKETADAPVGVQAAENDAPVSDDAWDTDTDTVTPITITGRQKVSRQLLDSATPAVDTLIASSLQRVYDQLVERRTVITIEQANPTLMTATAGTDPTVATHYNKKIVDAMTEVFATRNLPPDLIFSSVRRFGKALSMTDTTGRPLILPSPSMGPANSVGQGSLPGAFGGSIWHGTEYIATPGELDDGRVYTLGREDAIHFESDVLRFRFEEVEGPQTIILGIWGYNAWWVMYKTGSVKGMSITGDGESA